MNEEEREDGNGGGEEEEGGGEKTRVERYVRIFRTNYYYSLVETGIRTSGVEVSLAFH